jgi:3-oxoacyl-[acyl-carrier protein] reductase
MGHRLLAGRAAIVTGAGRGIGRAIALALAHEGASVALAARTETELQAVAAEIGAGGGEAACFPTDISVEDQVRALMHGAVGRFGRLDVLVNNAGIGIYGPLADYGTEDWDRVMAVNARGTFMTCREAIPYLRQQSLSYIVNVVSVLGFKGYVDQGAYTASKHAIMGLSKVLAKEVHADNIRVHAVCPGGVDTELIGRARPDLDRSVLIGPEEIAEIVLFLVTRRGQGVIDEIYVRRAASTPWG